MFDIVGKSRKISHKFIYCDMIICRNFLEMRKWIRFVKSAASAVDSTVKGANMTGQAGRDPAVDPIGTVNTTTFCLA